MQLPNNTKLAGVICDMIELITSVCQAEGLPRPTSAEIAGLWDSDQSRAYLTSLKSRVTRAESLAAVQELCATSTSTFLAYAFYVRGDKDEKRDYNAIRAYVALRAKTGIPPARAPLAVVRRDLKENN